MNVNVFIQDLRRENNFLRRSIDTLRKENKMLKEKNTLYENLIKQKVKVKFDRYDPKKFAGLNEVIDREALLLCRSTGSWFYWKELYDRLVVKFRNVEWNPETVRRRCQLAVKDGLLVRVKPGTYIYNIHCKE